MNVVLILNSEIASQSQAGGKIERKVGRWNKVNYTSVSI